MSSAKNFRDDTNLSGRSLMYMLKNNSPNIDHWSTPALTGNQHGYLTKPAETCYSRAFKCICCKNTHVYVHSK